WCVGGCVVCHGVNLSTVAVAVEGFTSLQNRDLRNQAKTTDTLAKMHDSRNNKAMGANNLRNLVRLPFRCTQNRPAKRAIRWSAVGAITGALAGTALAAIPTLASIFARTVVTPQPHPAEDVRIVEYRRSATAHDHDVVELALTNQTQVRGRY